MELPALEREVLRLLSELPTSGSKAEQLALFQRVQELVFHRDPTGDAHALLHAAAPYVATLAQHQNATLVAALLHFLAQAAQRSPLLLRELYEVINTLLMLSFSTEKNVMSAIQLALTSLPQAFQFVNETSNNDSGLVDHKRALWAAVTSSLEHMVEIVATTPLLPIGSADSNNNRSALVWLRAWKYLESAVLLLTTAQDAVVYRDPARSNVQPDELTIDRIVTAPEHPVLDKSSLEALGVTITKCLCERLGRTLESGGAMLQPLGRREVCVAINSIALIAALRPHLMQFILPSLVGFHNESLPGSSDGVVLATLKSNLIKLLSHPAAQASADEVTECLISLGASERAFRAISKSKEPRRKYVSAPSEASLRKARIGKRSAQSIAEKVENDTYKRNRIGDVSSSSYTTNTSSSNSSASAMTSTSSSQQITHEGIVNMASSAVVNLVLESFASELPGPPPPNLKLELTPSELKARMLALLGKIATPSSVLAIENSNKRMRDPRRRRDPRVANQKQPSLVQIFDGDAVDEVSDWVSKNASSIAEPLISVSEDNVVQVFLKPATVVWCREMAVAALSRILENEYGVSIRGDEKLRESVLCRLASSPWLLLTDDKNNQIDVALSDSQVPAVYKSILDFVLEDFAMRSTLAMALVYHEYTRFMGDQLTAASVDTDAMETGSEETQLAPTTDAIYRKTSAYFFSSLVKKMDLSSAADKKLFGALIAQLPRVTIEILQVLGSLFDQKSGVVLGITALRDLIKERAVCQTPALRILLRYTCHEEEGTRNSSIRCVANQLYSLDALKEPIEQFAIRLVQSLGSGAAAQQPSTGDDDDDSTGAGDANMEDTNESEAKVIAAKRQWLQNQIRSMRAADKKLETELLAFATQRQDEILLSKPLENEQETLRRIELYLALCAKKPTLLTHIVATYAHASDAVRQVIFHAVEKLIKHLKQRGSVNVVAQLHGFEPNALGFVCHVIQILSVRARPNEESAATEELVQQVIALYHAHEHIPDAISVLIPILPSIRADVLFPLLPQLLSLPQTRLSVAITRLLEAMPPQVVAPIDLLVALHHVDLKSEPAMQKKVISAINFCVEHRHAFPSDVLLHVCRVLVQDERISKLALRTLILSVTAYPSLQQDMTALLEILVARRVWEMEDALWKGFVKCSALIQPASFPLLLTRLPPAQLQGVLEDEPELRKLLQQFVASPEAPSDLRISPEVRELIAIGEVEGESKVKGEVKQEEFEEGMEVAVETGEVEEDEDFVKNDENAPVA